MIHSSGEMKGLGIVMRTDRELNRRLIVATAETVIRHAEELSELDRAIGDGDHGLNMKRGFEAVLADLDGLASKPLPDLLKAVGTHLVMKVGGASGKKVDDGDGRRELAGEWLKWVCGVTRSVGE